MLARTAAFAAVALLIVALLWLGSEFAASR
jgi:hypothetical protein